MRAAAFAALTTILFFFPSGCRKKPPRPAVPKIGATETGIASWYGHPYHGRRAANGEVYDMEKLTAAHRTFAFGTWLRVHNLDTGKTVDVRVTDRGPFVRGRIIDLSRAAARSIDLIGPGTARVRLVVLAANTGANSLERFAVQVGAFRDRTNAENLRRGMQDRFGSARLVPRDGSPVLWRVLVGEFSSIEEAESVAARIHSKGDPAFVVRLDR